MRHVPNTERQKLLCLTASSGSITNLQLLLPVVGRNLASEVVAAAAAGGHVETCAWLRQQDCPWDEDALEEAGRANQENACGWLIAAGCPGGVGSALEGAARAGHVGLVDRLLAVHGPPERAIDLLVAAAEGCYLPTLQRLHATLLVAKPGLETENLSDWDQRRLPEAAAGSPTPDWRAKVEWLEAQGCPREAPACTAAARCEDAVVRLTWLTQRGWPLGRIGAGRAAALRGDTNTLHFLQLDDADMQAEVVHWAAAAGHLDALRTMQAWGWPLGSAAEGAARHGHMHVVAWAVEALGPAALSAELFSQAAMSGSRELLGWLRSRGCAWDEWVWAAAAEGGCEEVLEWLAAEGCPMPAEGQPYGRAADNGDHATLSCLRRLGVPWAPAVFTDAVGFGSGLASLQGLLKLGFPVDWEEAHSAALHGYAGRDVLSWVQQQLQQGQPQET